MHRYKGHYLDTKHPIIVENLLGIKRQIGVHQKAKKPLLFNDLKQIIKVIFVSLFSKKIIKSEHLKLAVEVLTSKTCSEEGLEDVTALLLNLSGPEATRDTILSLLLQGKFGKNSDKTHSFYHQSLFLLSKIVKS